MASRDRLQERTDRRATDRLVGVTTQCDYPPEVAGIAKIGDPEKRIEILAQAIDEKWSVKEIQNWRKEQSQGAEIQEVEETPAIRIGRTMKKLQGSKAWENPSKWKKIQALLMKIEQELGPEGN